LSKTEGFSAQSGRAGWILARMLVSLAAMATTGWSLFFVATHYGTPKLIAYAAVVVFDGIAYACLHLASEASAEGRSAFAPRLFALIMVGVSVALNVNHAQLIHGGATASLLFAVPTVGLLAVSEMSWTGPRALRRAQAGERPYRPPVFGGIAWALAPAQAGKAVRSGALNHIEKAAVAPMAPQRARSAQAVLREHFAEMDPVDAVLFAADAQPELSPAELSSLLVSYGMVIDSLQVAIILARPKERITLERADEEAEGSDAAQVPALPPVPLSGAIVSAAGRLGPEAKPSDIAREVAMHHGIAVTEAYVRTALSRENKDSAEDGEVGLGGGGYA
jgi:hypothetical protein